MRFLLTIAIWIVFVGGLYLYTSQRNATATVAAETATDTVEQRIEHRITIELTPTFSIEEDPFALQTDAKKEPLEVRLNGTLLSVAADDFSRGKSLIIKDASLILADHNELYVKASPPMTESSLAHGIRVRLLDGERTLADSTIWSSGGGLVSGNVSFELNDEDTGHDH